MKAIKFHSYRADILKTFSLALARYVQITAANSVDNSEMSLKPSSLVHKSERKSKSNQNVIFLRLFFMLAAKIISSIDQILRLP
jgi:hypothetical protein